MSINEFKESLFSKYVRIFGVVALYWYETVEIRYCN